MLKKLKIWDSRSKTDVLRNSNRFTESLSYQWINQYVGNKIHPNSNDLHATDGNKKSTYLLEYVQIMKLIALNALHHFSRRNQCFL